MCKLYRYHVGSLKDPEEYEKRRQRASRERLQRMDRCIECGNEEGALVQLGVAAVLDEALKPFHLQERSVTIQTGEFGKPYISGDNIHYNISHSGDYVVCAVSNHEIGVDIQKVTGDHMKLAKRFFHPMEWEYLENCKTEPERVALFHRLWSLKESFVKCLGTGMAIGLSEFNIQLYSSGSYCEYNNVKYYFYEENDAQYSLSICTQGALHKVSCYNLSKLL